MSIKPEISIIMAVYNAAEYVGRSIQSVLSQSFSDFELICVDDGSSDNSIAELERWAGRDARIRVLAEPHRGACATLNAGLEAARGKLIAFLDNDDAFHPRALEIAKTVLDRHQLDVVIWDRQDCEEDGSKVVAFDPITEIPDIKVLTDYVGWGMGAHHVAFWCKLYRREVIGDFRFEPTITYGDVLFHWRILSRHNLRVAHLPLRLHWYCVRPGSVMHSTIDEKKAIDRVRVFSFIRSYVEHDSSLWPRLRKESFPEGVWSIYKVSRRQKELRDKIFSALKTLLADKTFCWFDLPLARHLKMRAAITLWSLFRKDSM